MSGLLTKFFGGSVARRCSTRPRLRIDSLEDRSVPAIITVTTAADNTGGVNPAVGAGTGTFRQALVDANASAVADTITFDTAGTFATPQVINLDAVLPTIASAGGALTITGTGVDNLTIRRSATAATSFRVFASAAGAANPLTMTDFTVSGGSTAAGITGAGLRAAGTVFLDRMTFSGNTSAATGGAIRIDTGGALSLKNSTISGNTAASTGGGIYFYDSGALLVENSTISGNTSAGNGGGGVYFYGTASATPPTADFTPNTLVIRNSTIVGNGSTTGGAVGLRGPAATGFIGELLVQNSTVTANTASVNTGGIAKPVAGAGVITVQNSVVAGNTGGAGPNISSTGTVNLNFSAIDNSAGFTPSGTSGNNVTATLATLNLGPLQNNGGPTRTIVPGAGPLIDGGSNALVPAGLTTDQRGAGFPRILDGVVNIGAVESVPPNNPTAAATTTTATGGTTYQFTVTYTDLIGANPGLDYQSILDNDAAVRVTGPNGFDVLATFVSLDVEADGSPRTATYEIAAPGGTFDAGDNGTYTISVEANQVFDLGGNPVLPATAGTFQVAVPIALTVTTDADAGPGSLRDAITQANASIGSDTIAFDPAFFNEANPRTISLLTALPQLPAAGGGLTIDGPGRDFLTVTPDAAAPDFRIIDSLAPTLDLSGFTITGGAGTSVGGAFAGGMTTFDDMAIVGNTATTASVGGVYIANGQSLVIANSVISNNTSANIGGGIWVGAASSLTLTNSTVSANTSVGKGAGIFVNNGGSATIIDSTVSGNTASAGVGGGIAMNANTSLTVRNSTISGNRGTVGGGIYFAYNGSLVLENSTVSGNTATTTTAGLGGGGVYFYGTADVMEIRNSTIANNTSGSSGGGLLLNEFYGTLVVENSTIIGNSAAATAAGEGGGGITHLGGGDGTIDIVNSIVAGNTNANGPDVLNAAALGTVVVNYSALSSTTGFTLDPGSVGNVIDTLANLGVGPLADNGGPTQTFALLAGSVLIDAGDDTAVTTATDQLGGTHDRIVGAAVDIGSYEAQPPGVTVEQGATQADPVSAGPIVFDITFDAAVSDFTIDDVTIGGTYAGTYTANLIALSPTAYQLEITDLLPGEEGTFEVTVAAGGAVDNTGVANEDSTSTDNSVTYDALNPTVTIDQGAGQADLTNGFPIVFDVVFAEDVTGFDFSDVTFTLGAGLTGTPVGTVTMIDAATYTVEVTGGITGVGTLTASLPAGAATDLAGNGSKAATSTDAAVEFDDVAPTVTINPTNPAPTVGGTSVRFDVVFSEPVVGLTGASFDTSASTATGTLTVTLSGTGPAYVATVSGMTSGGTIVLTLPAGAVQDPAGNDNLASTGDTDVTFVNSGTLQFSAPTYSVSEQGGVLATITVTRVVTGTAEGTLSVDYATVAGGTATAGADYTTTTGTLTFGPADTSLTFTIPVLDDALVEGDETVNLALTNVSVSGGLGTPATAVLTITDFEEGGFTFSAPTFSGAEGGTATITINRVGGSDTPATVDYGFVLGTAEATDIGAPSTAAGTLAFAVGETTKTITVPIVEDALSEGNETINLTLANPTGGTGLGANPAAVLVIEKSDPIVVGAAQKYTLKLTDTDSDTVTVKLSGTKVGTMNVYKTDDAAPVSVIDLIGVDAAKSSLSVSVAKAKKAVNPNADGKTTVEEVNGDGLKSLSAAKVDLIGAGVNFTGYVGSVTFADVSNGADIITGGAPFQKTKVTLGVVGDGSDVTTGGVLNGLTATSFGDGAITAPSASTIQIKGNAKIANAGDFGGDLTLSGMGVNPGKSTLTTLKVAGSVLAGSDIDVTGKLGTVSVGTAKGALDVFAGSLTADSVTTITVNGNLTGDINVTGAGVLPGKFALNALKVVGAKVGAAIIGGTVDGSTITVGSPTAVGNVNSVSAVQFLNSTFYVGYAGPNTGTGTFNPGGPAAGTVNSFSVTGSADAFANSDAVASTFKKVTLKSVDTTNGDRFGFVANDGIASLKVTTPAFTFTTADGTKTVDQFTVQVI